MPARQAPVPPLSASTFFQAGRRSADEDNEKVSQARWLRADATDTDRRQFELGLAAELAARIQSIPMVLQTSNSRKLAEFRRFGLALEARSGADLVEVDGTPEEVAQYKALAAGPGVLVEDTSLDVEGYAAGVNIRWLLHAITTKLKLAPESPEPRAVWRVMVAVHYEGRMFVAGAAVSGRLTPQPRGEGFSFDCYFIPDGEALTLGELDAIGKKDKVSARKMAVTNLLGGHCVFRPTKALPAWTGKYQDSA